MTRYRDRIDEQTHDRRRSAVGEVAIAIRSSVHFAFKSQQSNCSHRYNQKSEMNNRSRGVLSLIILLPIRILSELRFV